MKVIEKYSHLNGEEYLLVHAKRVYKELLDAIGQVNAGNLRTKISKEKRTPGARLYNPSALNEAFRHVLHGKLKWESTTYSYYVTTDRAVLDELLPLSLKEQRKFLTERGISDPIRSYKQTDFVKDKIAVEVQFGKYAFVAYDLFVKHMLFYSGGIIDVGIEILPMRQMQAEMSSGIAYFEGEVYNILRQGRNNPPVPLLVLGIAP